MSHQGEYVYVMCAQQIVLLLIAHIKIHAMPNQSMMGLCISGDWWTGPSIFAAKHLQPVSISFVPLEQ